MLIQLEGKQAELYRTWLSEYTKLSGQAPTYKQTTEAFFCARSNDLWNRPEWMK